MTRYLIKATRLDGPHARTSYLLRKGGYVTHDSAPQFADTTYSTRGYAVRTCNHLKYENTLDVRFDEWMAEHTVNPNRQRISFSESYEPYPVEV